jgi:hypothetical protein
VDTEKKKDKYGNEYCPKCSVEGRRVAVLDKRIPDAVEHTCHKAYLGCDCKYWYEIKEAL